MKLHVLSLFVRSLIEPLSHAAPGGADDLRRAADMLASLGDVSVGQFADLVAKAKEYEESRRHAFPAYLRPVIECAERVGALKARAMTPDATRDELMRDLDAVPLDDLDALDLTRIAAEHEWPMKKKAKPDAIDAIWRGITGAGRPKKKASPAKRTTKPKESVNLDEYVQKIDALKERASQASVTREDVESDLTALKLDKLTKPDLVALGRKLSCDVGSGTTKPQAIDAIKRIVREAREMIVTGAG